MVNQVILRNLLNLHRKAGGTLGCPCGDATRTPPSHNETPHREITIFPNPTDSLNGGFTVFGLKIRCAIKLSGF
jgi:hypothetical protein